jgi:hypothetical protein
MIEIAPLFDRLRQSESASARLLPDLLEALDWSGEAIQLRNAISGSPQSMDGVDLMNTLANLGYRWTVIPLSARTPLAQLQRLDYPLALRADQPNWEFRLVQTAEQLAGLLALDQAYYAYDIRFEPERAGEKRQWFQAQVLRFRGGITELYVISLLINLLALAMPFYIRAVYNIEIPGGQVGDLFLLLPFAITAVLLQLWLTQRRQARLADLGAELDLLLSIRVLEKVLLLRLPQLERYTPLTLANRLRSFQGLRTYLTGPVALAALDLPFIGIFLVAIAVMSVPLMLLTVLMVLVCFGDWPAVPCSNPSAATPPTWSRCCWICSRTSLRSSVPEESAAGTAAWRRPPVNRRFRGLGHCGCSNCWRSSPASSPS